MARGLMRVDRLAEGLWRWTGPAPPDGAEGNALYHEAPDGIVLIDPVLPDDRDQAERFWRALDRDVERIGRPPLVVLADARRTAAAAAVAARYPGSRVLAPGDDLPDGDVLPGGIEAIVPAAEPGGSGGAFLACACHGLVWTGDLLDGDAARHAPLLARLLAHGPRFLVGSHGEPVVEDAAGALTRALA
ncbi:MAG: hypothetical protein ACKO7U_01675 [Actinomycetota bacterium]